MILAKLCTSCETHRSAPRNAPMVDTDIDLARGHSRRNDRTVVGRRRRRKPLPREPVDGVSREYAVRYTRNSAFVFCCPVQSNLALIILMTRVTLHSTTEVLLSSAFLMRKLESTGFEYPFTGLETPTQHAYALMGRDNLASMHTYAIMAAEGRIASFNTFMQGRFGMDAKTPARLQSLGYDLSSVVQGAIEEGNPVRMVDIGGGRGDLLRDIKDAIPGLGDGDLIVAESNADITHIPGLTLVNWDYIAEDVPGLIKEALVYHLSGVLHNLPDLGAARLLQKIAGVMASYSRVLIHERCRDNIPAANATMVVLYGGRERSREDWRQLAELAGLKVTHMVFPDGAGAGVVEMRKA